MLPILSAVEFDFHYSVIKGSTTALRSSSKANTSGKTIANICSYVVMLTIHMK